MPKTFVAGRLLLFFSHLDILRTVVKCRLYLMTWKENM